MKWNGKFISKMSAMGALMMAVVAWTPIAVAKETVIRVGYTITTDIASAALFSAQKKGLFAKAGLDVEAQPFVSSSQKYDAYRAKAIDLDINSGAVEAAQLWLSGFPVVFLKAIQPADFWAVVVPRSSSAKGPKDFKGKPYGVVSMTGTNFTATYLAFKIDHVDLMSDVRVSVLPPSELLAALRNGTIAGATLYEPYLSEAISEGAGKELFRPMDVYENHYHETMYALGVTARKAYFDQHTAAVKKFMQILDAEAKELPKELPYASGALAHAVPALKLSPERVEALLKPYAGDYIEEGNDPGFVRKVQTFYNRVYAIKQLPKPVEAAQFWVRP